MKGCKYKIFLLYILTKKPESVDMGYIGAHVLCSHCCQRALTRLDKHYWLHRDARTSSKQARLPKSCLQGTMAAHHTAGLSQLHSVHLCNKMPEQNEPSLTSTSKD